jgi:hypothetical protein
VQKEEVMKIEFDSSSDLAAAMSRAASAHEQYEETLGHRDEDWPSWYAKFIEQEQSKSA